MNSKEEKYLEERYYNLLLEELELELLKKSISYWKERRKIGEGKLIENIPLKKAIERIDDLINEKLFYFKRKKEVIDRVDEIELPPFS